MKISLVCPTNYYGASATRGLYYPMGILLVGSLTRDTMPSWEIDVIDGELYSRSELEERLRGVDILGVSANTNNYKNCIELAEFAKSNGTRKVVIGGPHASAIISHGDRKISMAELILRNQSSIDAIIVNDGEEPFLRYVMESSKKNPNYESIENLSWRGQLGTIQRNSRYV